jgi:hypothetical protein
MINEKKEILNAKINKNESKFNEIIKELHESFFELFYFILKNPVNNIWWQCISITIQYAQMLLLILNSTVSNRSSFI